MIENYDLLKRLYQQDENPSKSKLVRKKTFSQRLFDDEFSQKVKQAVLKTSFFQRIINNTLSPEDYGGFNVEDAAYIYEAIHTFDFAAKEMDGKSPSDFALFYRGRSDSYASYSRYFDSDWKIKDQKSVKMGPAAATYVAYEKKLAETKPKFLAIGILPCDMLWPWVAAEIDNQVPKTNVYRSWVDNNLSNPSSLSSTQKFVNKFFSSDNDFNTAQRIFNEGMINELNFFRSACDEHLADYTLSNI